MNLRPKVTAVNPAPLERDGILVYLGEPLGDALLIPVASLGDVSITGADGSSWAPEVAHEGTNIRLLPDPARPYASGVTYHVSVQIEYALAPSPVAPLRFQFTVR